MESFQKTNDLYCARS